MTAGPSPELSTAIRMYSPVPSRPASIPPSRRGCTLRRLCRFQKWRPFRYSYAALSKMEVLHPRRGRVVECRIFGGMTVDVRVASPVSWVIAGSCAGRRKLSEPSLASGALSTQNGSEEDRSAKGLQHESVQREAASRRPERRLGTAARPAHRPTTRHPSRVPHAAPARAHARSPPSRT